MKGNFCETLEDFCASNPCENGNCIPNADGTGTCTCPAGYFGQFCEAQSCGGSKNPCQNNSDCVQASSNSLKCLCKTGYAGKYCEIAV